MTFRKKVFVSQKVTLLVGGKELKVQALVSTYGAKYVFDEGELPEAIRDAVEKEVEILYKNVPARCRVVREATSAGTVYSFRFVNPSGLLLRQIERDVEENGLPSPWLRSLPRLNASSKSLPVPALLILDYQGENLFLNVKNFTLGGLMVEFVGDRLKEVGPGTQFNFDLVTNGGDKISDISALVTNLSVELSKKEGDLMRIHFGLKFLPMNLLAEAKYRALIKDHCLKLKEGPGASL